MFGTVYLLHFTRPISAQHTCQHYLGWCLDLEARIAAHRAGRGARLTQVAVERGIDFVVAWSWPGDRTLERRLKNRKESPRLCPLCFPAARRPAAVDAVQLELPLISLGDITSDTIDFPAPPRWGMDWLEGQILRGWRASSPTLAAAAVGEWDVGLL